MIVDIPIQQILQYHFTGQIQIGNPKKYLYIVSWVLPVAIAVSRDFGCVVALQFP